ncbi:hypothetical protein AVEN_147270-1 [Araneus ventricosus]|uniref:Uncharacterized protein n=1 Tax=Araneus ventricosus TaxID=182803 RepID=A0A4Y2TFF0_ARAVE|nr:hypothetical protein AVEN_147270-1 [Araneus ventricosus]
MLGDGVILLHDNTHTARKTQELLRKFKWEVWSHPYSSYSAPNLGSKHLSGRRFSCGNNSREVTQWTGRDFCQTGLNKLVLR